MKTIYAIGIILFIVIAYSIYDLYHLSCLFGIDCTDEEIDNTPVVPTQSSVSKEAVLEQKPKDAKLNSAAIYQDNQYVPNKGFVNELIFKYPTYSDELKQTSNDITNNVPNSPLNPVTCKMSTDLPIANINVNYMLQKNTNLLR
jgi:hypothetical protein